MEQLPDNVGLDYLNQVLNTYHRSHPLFSKLFCQEAVAKRFNFSDWKDLRSYISIVEVGEMTTLEKAIIEDDVSKVKKIVNNDRNILKREVHWKNRRRHNHLLPLGYAAYCGSSNSILALIEMGADIHAYDEQALRNAVYFDRNIESAKLLLELGADPHETYSNANGVTYEIVDYPCMTLAPKMLDLLSTYGVELEDKHAGILLSTNERRPADKAECLRILTNHGVVFPDTPVFFVHMRDEEKLRSFFSSKSTRINSFYNQEDIFPDKFGISKPPVYAYVVPLLFGVTLLHMAVEFCDQLMVDLLIELGADVNSKTVMDSFGCGGWTPLFHSVATLHQPRNFGGIVETLIENGADPQIRASICKHYSENIQDSVTWKNVTVMEFVNELQEDDLRNETAIEFIRSKMKL